VMLGGGERGERPFDCLSLVLGGFVGASGQAAFVGIRGGRDTEIRRAP
jgi:hypothetical protein